MTSPRLTIKFYSDPGHGWAAVKRKVLYDLGIQDKISFFSYQKGATVYLEEDCDLACLTTALSLKGVFIEYKNSHMNRSHPIRGYDRYKV